MAIEKYPLHPILTPIDYEERLKILENWTRITSYFNSVEVKIKFLSGGEEIEDILNRINTAVANAQDVTANTQQALDDVNNALSQLNTVISNTNAAAGRADVAADGANQLNVILTTLKGELETLQTDLNGIVQAEAQRVSNESGRVSAEQTRSTDETTRRENEAARMLKEQARENAETQRTTTFNAKMLTADEKIVMMQYLIDNLASYDYNPTATFNFPNLIKSNGSTFIALQEVQGVTPVDDGINYRLVAQRGVDGTGAVSSVNGIAPDTNGNVQVIMELVNNLISDSTTAGLTAAQGKALKVMFDALQQAFNSHATATDNPHSVTADQLALGNVQNFEVATQVEAETGTASDKYMTPVRTKQAIDKNLVTISESVDELDTRVTQHLAQRATKEQLGHIKLQENWRTLTTLNGWLDQISYAKNDLEYVTVKGIMTVGVITDGTIIAQLPAGYRPTLQVSVIAYNQTQGGKLTTGINVFADGNIAIFSLTNANIGDTININVSFCRI